jgi:7,8-dihydro-6-hydroxymethylpterin dimethyltransferase
MFIMDASTLTGLCGECAEPVPAHYAWIGDDLFLEKNCGVHGLHRTLVSTDRSYQAQVELTADLLSERLARTADRPLMIFLEIIDECDLACKTCIAGSLPNTGNARNPADVIARVRAYAEKHGAPQILLLTGGEPALHPELMDIIHGVSSSVDQVALITNGIKLAEEPAFVSALAAAAKNLHVYLQFDSLRSDALVELRGRDLTPVRLAAVENLGKFEIATTLVSVIKRGVNDQDIVPTVEFALKHDHILGVTFQPIRASGRHSVYDRSAHGILLTEIRSRLMSGFAIPDGCIRPHPADPHRIAIGYVCRLTMESLTDRVMAPVTAETPPLYLAPDAHQITFADRSALRVAIVSYYDQHDVTIGDQKPKGIIFLTDEGCTITLEDRFLFSNLLPVQSQPVFIRR